MAASDILLLGPASAGKTSLVRTLCSGKSGKEDSKVMDTMPTTGVEIDHLPAHPAVSKKGAAAVPAGLAIREVGSAMKSMWPTYLPGARKLVVSRARAMEEPGALHVSRRIFVTFVVGIAPSRAAPCSMSSTAQTAAILQRRCLTSVG